MERLDLLVLDDDDEMGAYVELALAPLGLSIRVFSALPAVGVPRARLALVDLMLAEPNAGLAAVARLSTGGPVVVMTGLAPEHPKVQAARSAGAQDVLCKPFGLAELRACVRRNLPAPP
ncbi:MAG: response regulator transcription factor [Myxococcales bacterium]|nr:response regulator transcription factor [Myxococcales bacterium]